MLNVVLLGAHFSSIIASFPVPRHDTFNAASLGAVCCHAALLKKSNTSYSCMCYTRKRKAEDLIVRACQILCMWFYWRHKGLIMSRWWRVTIVRLLLSFANRHMVRQDTLSASCLTTGRTLTASMVNQPALKQRRTIPRNRPHRKVTPLQRFLKTNNKITIGQPVTYTKFLTPSQRGLQHCKKWT